MLQILVCTYWLDTITNCVVTVPNLVGALQLFLLHNRLLFKANNDRLEGASQSRSKCVAACKAFAAFDRCSNVATLQSTLLVYASHSESVTLSGYS